MLYHAPHLVGRIPAAGVFHAVRGDDEQRALRHVLRPGIFVYVPDVADGPAHRVQQSRAAADAVFLFGDGTDLAQLHPVVQHLDPVVKEDGGDQGLAGLLFLLFQHGVETADGVLLQSLHGTAAVQDEYQLRQIRFHN